MLTTNDPLIDIQTETVSGGEAEEIYRNLRILYNTAAGEQALDRDFGIDADILDYPLPSAQALLTAEYVRKTEKYEPRARVSRVEWIQGSSDSGLKPKVVVQIV